MKLFYTLKRSLVLVAASVLAAVGLSSCIDGKAVVTLAPDGSGTIATSFQITAPARAFMKQQGQKNPADQMPKEDELKEAASKMGEGFSVNKVEPIKEGVTDEIIGYNVEYAFKDITKLKLGPNPKEQKLHLSFKPGSLSLNLDLPVEVKDEKAEAPKEEKAVDPQEAMQQQFAMVMMKQMLAGSKIKLSVKAGSKITKSNATYVDGNEMTIIEVNLDEALADAKFMDVMKSFQSAQKQEPTPGQVLKMINKLKELKGIKIETTPKIDVNFE